MGKTQGKRLEGETMRKAELMPRGEKKRGLVLGRDSPRVQSCQGLSRDLWMEMMDQDGRQVRMDGRSEMSPHLSEPATKILSEAAP